VRLPERLEPLVADGPVFDLYAYGPWAVPGRLLGSVRKRLVKVARDAGAGEPGDSPVLAEVRPIVDFLCGAGAVRGGTHADLATEILRPYLPAGTPYGGPAGWTATAADIPRLPALREHADRATAYCLARGILDALAGIEPLEPRRTALRRLFANPPEADGAGAWPGAWAARADDAIVAAIPELAGHNAYLAWVCDGLFAAHDRLRSVVPHRAGPEFLAGWLLLQAGQDTVPDALLAAMPAERFRDVADVLGPIRFDFSGEKWAVETAEWARKLLWRGEAELVRGWLDMAVRFSAVVGLAPDAPYGPFTHHVPVGDVQAALLRMYAPRRDLPANPLVPKPEPAPVPPAVVPEEPPAPPANPLTDLADGMIDQPELAAAVAEVAAGTGPVRLMLVGPDGTGKRRAAKHITELVQARDAGEGEAKGFPFWVAADHLLGRDVWNATTYLGELADRSVWERMLIIDGLDTMAGNAGYGEAVLEELHRSMDLYPNLYVIAICESGGDARVRELNPALALRFQVAHARPFGTEGYRELFGTAVRLRGARATRPAVEAAGELLSRTRPVRNMRNARLAHRLAEQAVDAARGRARDDEPVVRRADIPATFNVTGSTGDPMAELAALTGLASVKRQVELVLADVKAAEMRRAAGLTVTPPARHMVLTGNPGTGKTEVARLLARAFADLGLLASGHVVEVTPSDIIGRYFDDTRKVIERAVGGVLLIDDAYALGKVDPSKTADAIATLVKLMEDHSDDLVVFAAGYQREMQDFLSANPGLASRFPTTMHFPDYADGELVEIFAAQTARAGLTLGAGAREKVTDLVRRAPRGHAFGNARLMRNLCQRTIPIQAHRVLGDGREAAGDLTVLLPADIPDTLSGVTRTIAGGDPLAELDAMVGLRAVKDEVRALVAEARAVELRRGAGRHLPTPTRHMVFSGNPGTAKTTVARLVARVYARLELLSSGHLVEVSRADLVGEYLGHTAPKVHRVVEQALGGVLFIDEAYALGADRFGMEAVAALVKLMEDHRGDLVVIAAGYEREMAAFLDANSGIRSRFAKHLRFPDYSDAELVEIFASLAAADGLTLAPGVPDAVRGLLRRTDRGASFGNGRHMRNILDAAVSAQARRLTTGPARPDTTEIITLRAADLPGPPAPDGRAPGAYL
jgi:SpoVK/Ycf46/Vps4 family AAA+-type ATPase